MNNIEKLLESLTVEFGLDPKIPSRISEAEYIRYEILSSIRDQNKKYTKADTLLIKHRSNLGMHLRWGGDPNEVIEVLRDLKIKKILISSEVVARTTRLKKIFNAFTQSGYSIRWDIDEKRFLMILSNP